VESYNLSGNTTEIIISFNFQVRYSKAFIGSFLRKLL